MGGSECIKWYIMIDESEHKKHFSKVPTIK